MSSPCPCSSKLTYDRCCEPYLNGKKQPETAEILMRSRFTAYAMGKADYLAATTAAAEREKLDVEELGRYCRAVRCISLKVLSTEGGGPLDETGVVVFHAKLLINGKRMLHWERSRFVREEGRWAYLDGETN
ncbi:MAG: YchJ family metal-binding protein [Holophaga sp.]|nr:YchJ family metal-binding protein [Holophaga sp.]